MWNRLKVEASVTNAKAFLEVQKEFNSFDKDIWKFIGNITLQNNWKSMKEIPATINESDTMSKDFKNRNFKILGSTIYLCLYAGNLYGQWRYQQML